MLRVSSSEKVCAKSFSLLFSLIANNVGFHKDTHFLAHLQSSVGDYPKSLHSLNMKNGRSDTPRSCARKPFILELSDSAEAFVDRSMK